MKQNIYVKKHTMFHALHNNDTDPSPIQTILSVPDLHRSPPSKPDLAGHGRVTD